MNTGSDIMIRKGQGRGWREGRQVPRAGVRLSAQATNDRFVHQTAHVGVPWHARRIYVELTTEHAVGTYCDSYFDNLSLVIRHVD